MGTTGQGHRWALLCLRKWQGQHGGTKHGQVTLSCVSAMRTSISGGLLGHSNSGNAGRTPATSRLLKQRCKEFLYPVNKLPSPAASITVALFDRWSWLLSGPDWEMSRIGEAYFWVCSVFPERTGISDNDLGKGEDLSWMWVAPTSRVVAQVEGSWRRKHTCVQPLFSC